MAGTTNSPRPPPARKRQRPTTTSKTTASQRHSKGRVVASSTTGMPDVPGVPPSIIPLLVQALRSTSRFLAHYQHQVLPPNYYMLQQEQPHQQLDAPSRKEDQTTVVDGILHRLQTSNPVRIEQERMQQQQSDHMIQALQSWLHAIHSNPQQQPRPTQSSSPQAGAPQPHHHHHSNIPLACFQFVWQLQWPEDHHHDSTTTTTTSTSITTATTTRMRRSITSRRAALHVAGLLLLKSRDCRQYWCHSTGSSGDDDGSSDHHQVLPERRFSLRAWIQQCLHDTTTATATTTTTSGESSSSLSLYQQEAYQLLQYLLEEGYGHVYPQLRVAQRLLQQTIPHVVGMMMMTGRADTTSGFINEDHAVPTNQQHPLQWRHHRDLAMQHVQQEMRVVHKLVQRARASLYVLVPTTWNDYQERDATTDKNVETSIHATTTKNKNATTTNSNNNNNNDGTTGTNNDRNDDDEDEDVDWEDGFNDTLDNDATASSIIIDDYHHSRNKNNHHSHSLVDDHQGAVERTLALMKATGSLRGGQIEIAFDPNQQQHDDEDEQLITSPTIAAAATTKALAEQARTRLQRCVIKLQQVHMPRLTAWVDGLTYADGLVQVNVIEKGGGGSSSWVLMSSHQRERRGQVLSQLLELKQKVASLLASAKRLGGVILLSSTSSTSSSTTTSNETKDDTTLSRNSDINPTWQQPTSLASSRLSLTKMARAGVVASQRLSSRDSSFRPADGASPARRHPSSSATKTSSRRAPRIQIQYRHHK